VPHQLDHEALFRITRYQCRAVFAALQHVSATVDPKAALAVQAGVAAVAAGLQDWLDAVDIEVAGVLVGDVSRRHCFVTTAEAGGQSQQQARTDGGGDPGDRRAFSLQV